MRRPLLLIAIGVLCCSDAIPQEQDSGDKEIEGAWRGITATTFSLTGAFPYTWEIKDGVISSTSRRPVPESKSKSKYRLVADKNPKEIDLVRESGAAAGKTLKGIYKVEKDTLVICHVSPTLEEPEKQARPTVFEFDSNKNPYWVLLTFRRQTP
jgi:uncharacterized protein (TIGR03067 family)